MAIYDLGRDLDYFQNVVSSAEWQGIDFDQIAFYFYDVLRGHRGASWKMEDPRKRAGTKVFFEFLGLAACLLE